MALRRLGALVAGMALAGASLLVVAAPGVSAQQADHELRIVKQIDGVDAGDDFTIEVSCEGWSDPVVIRVDPDEVDGSKLVEEFDVAQASGGDTDCTVVETDDGDATSVGFSCLFVDDIPDEGQAASDSECTDVSDDSVAVHIDNGNPVEATVTITNRFEAPTTTTTTTTVPASSTAPSPAPPAVLGIARFTG